MSSLGSAAALRREEVPSQPRVPFPTEISDDDLVRYFSLSEQDLAQIRQARGNQNRLGVALQLCHVRWTGRFATSFESVSTVAVKHVAEQLGLTGVLPFLAYPQRDRTRREHNEAIRKYAGLRVWRASDPNGLRDELVARVLKGDLEELDMIRATEDLLKQRKVLLPGPSVLRDVVRRAGRCIERVVVETINGRIDDELAGRMEDLLEREPGNRHSRLQELKKHPQRANQKTLLSLCRRIRTLHDMGIERVDFMDIQAERTVDFADRVRHYWPTSLKRFRSPKKRAFLACFLSETFQDAVDGAVKSFGRVMKKMENRARDAIKKDRTDFRKVARSVARDWVKVGTVIRQPENRCRTIEACIFATMPEAEVDASIVQAQEILTSDKTTLIERLTRRYGSTRRFTPALYEAVKLLPISDPKMRDLVEAVDAVRTANREHKKKLPADVPRSFVPRAWKPFVEDEDGEVNRGAFEVCLAFEVKEAISRGDIAVKGSRKYVHVSSLLYPDETWETRRSQEYEARGLPEDVDVLLAGLNEQLARAALETDSDFPENTYASIENGKLRTKRDPAMEEDPDAKKLQSLLAARIAAKRVEQIIHEVDRATGFTEILQPPTGYDRRMPVAAQQRATHAGILGLATGLGLWTMGQMSNISYSQLAHVAQWCLTAPLLSAANDHVVNCHHGLPLAKLLGGGRQSSSDGIRFGVRGSTLLGEPNPKYFGWGDGLTSYKAMSDQWSIFSTQLISCNEHEALRVLGALLSNRTVLPLGGGHAADAASISYATFALFPLTGRPFWPRPADMSKVRLYKMDRKLKLNHIEPLFAELVKTDLIRQEWDNIVRLVASLQDELAPPHIIGRCLSSASPNNPLGLAVTELGKIYYTIYVLQLLNSPELRRAIRRLTSRQESQNQLGRAMVLGAGGKLRVGSYQVAAACLLAHTLLETLILYSNTCAFEELIPEIEAEGFRVRPKLLAKVSPLIYRHINFRGAYDFNIT